MNYFGWIDFSRRDRDIVRDIIESLNEPRAVDELGIGVIRDAFADYFFPGTSTIQTIAKYFFLVSYQLEELTRSPNPKLEQALRKMEHECSLAMWKSLSPSEQKRGNAGIFGRTFFERGSRDWVKRAPSMVYWGGIRKLGLLKCDNSALSLTDFLRISTIQESVPAESDEDLKKGKITTAGYENSWHWNLPPVGVRGDWKKSPQVKLTLGEATFFIGQIRKELPDSMFALLVNYRSKLPDNFTMLGNLPLPEHLKDAWQLAYDFSEFIRPSQIRFNMLLGNTAAPTDWKEYSTKKLKRLAKDVDLTAIFTMLQIEKHSKLFRFLDKLRNIYRTADMDAFDDLLFDREKELKGKARMKLGKNDPYYQDVQVGSFGLDYRYRIAYRLLKDTEEVQ